MEMEQSFHDYLEEWKKTGEEIIPHSVDLQGKSYKVWLKEIGAIRKGETCPFTLVPADTYFMTDGSDRIIGAVNIRHELNDYLFKFGGHIGYGVRPTERRKGYASTMLKLALQKCLKLNLTKVLVVCDKENPASARTIIGNSGVLENEILEGDRIRQRFWISIE